MCRHRHPTTLSGSLFLRLGAYRSPLEKNKLREYENRSEYALAGDVVNLAARLAAASEKEGKGVLCDETTLESLTGEVSSTAGYLD